jgi:hypothetical protein
MVQIPSWEANSWSASYEIPHLLWNQKVHCRVHKIPPPTSILSHMNQIRTLQPYFPKISFNIVLSSTPRSFKWSLSFRLSSQNFVRISHLPNSCQMVCPCHLPLFDDPNNIWWIHIIKLLIMQFFFHPPVTSSALSLNVLLSSPFSNTVSLCSSINVETKFHTHTKQEVKLWFCTF